MQIWLQNAKIVLPITIVQTVVYMAFNHFPPSTPRDLPLTDFDRAIPFWPWTIIPYLGYIIAQIGLALAVRDRAIFRQAIWAYGFAMGTTLLVHLLWPTRIERPDPVDDGAFLNWAYRLLLTCDPPNACFPSAHVVGPVVIFWAYWRDGRWMGKYLVVLLPILTLSILTTKQHYLWDWLGGWAMGGLGIALSYYGRRR